MNSQRIGNTTTKMIMLVVGLLFLLPASYKIYLYSVFRMNSASAWGVIAGSSRSRDIGARPFVEYQDSKGNKFERKSKAKTHWLFAPKKGEKIKVFYNPIDPNVALVDSITHYIVLPIVFILIGLSVIVYLVRGLLEKK